VQNMRAPNVWLVENKKRLKLALGNEHDFRIEWFHMISEINDKNNNIYPKIIIE
jgi:hypothetical protein